MNFQPHADNVAVMRHYFRTGRSAANIALEVGCAIRTAERWVQKFRREELDGTPAVDGRTNRVTAYKMSVDELDQAVELLRQDPFMAASDLPALLVIDVTAQTMRSNLKYRRNIHNYKGAKNLN